MKAIRLFFVSFLALAFVLSPVSFSNIAVLSQAVETEEITGYQEWNQSRTIDRNVVVNPGATLVIGKGIEISFTNPALEMQVEGNLFIQGTVKEPVGIKGDPSNGGFSITAETGSSITIRNAEIVNGGSEAFLIGKLNTATAANYKAAIQVNGGNVDIQNTTFRSNLYAMIVSSSTADVRVNRSRFIDNDFDVEAEGTGADFRYNWWGSPDGPKETCYDYVSNGTTHHYCYYEKIYGDFDHSSPLTQESFRDPVLIIPGILGSQEKNGELVLDPVYHVYDNLYDAFVKDGYIPEQDLFVFPYEWRDSNIETAKLLQGKLDEIRQSLNWPKIDIVAHSMGGLLAREYVESDSYGNDIDQLITLATPHLGAPEAYIKWDGAAWFLSPLDLYMKHVVAQEAEESGFSDIFDYIHSQVVSIQELLPIYDYLYDLDNDEELRKYPDSYPRNEFLENLDDKSGNLSKIEFDKIIGNLEEENTIGGMNVTSVDMGKYWANGYPLGFEIPLGSRGMRLTSGDRTVPLYSAKSENLKSDYTIELPSDHRSIVTDAQKDALELLTGNRPQEEVKRGLIHGMLFVSVYSPVDIQVISPSGLRVGKDFDGGGFLNEIPGAYYTGSDTKNEFITIPNPEDGKYTILARGTAEGGTYRIETTKITEAESGETTESTATIEGEAVAGMMEEDMSVEVSADTVELIEDKDVVAPTITIISPESKTYTNSGIIPVSYSVSDDVSPEDKLTTVVSLDGEAYIKADIDLSLLALGAHTLSVSSTDEAGNIGEAQADFTLATSWDALLENIDHYATLGFLKNKGERKMLENNIRRLGETAEILEKYDVFFRLHPKLRDIFEREIAHRLSILQRYVEHKSGKSIDPLAAQRLVESMEALKSR